METIEFDFKYKIFNKTLKVSHNKYSGNYEVETLLIIPKGEGCVDKVMKLLERDKPFDTKIKKHGGKFMNLKSCVLTSFGFDLQNDKIPGENYFELLPMYWENEDEFEIQGVSRIPLTNPPIGDEKITRIRKLK
jgi:mRNA-degrading endonuclease YafQ of YafQ-DinJ toxin-antitoxin module